MTASLLLYRESTVTNYRLISPQSEETNTLKPSCPMIEREDVPSTRYIMNLPRDLVCQPFDKESHNIGSNQDLHACGEVEDDSWTIPPLLKSRPTADADTDESIDWSNGGSCHKPMVPVRGECQCCFDTILSSSNCVTCTLPEAHCYDEAEHELLSHKFCKDCIRKYVESWLFGGSVYKIPEYEVTLPCPSADCSHGTFSHDSIQQCLLPSHPEVWARYQEKVFELVSLKEAAMLGEQLPRRKSFPPRTNPMLKDDFHALAVYDSELEKYHDENNEIKKKSSSSRSKIACSGEETTTKPPELVRQETGVIGPIDQEIVCRQVAPVSPRRKKNQARRSNSENDKDEAQRKQLEETMSAAKIRHCPKCSMAFLKETGCNKLTCPQCRTSMCNVCRLGPVTYEHFCNHRWWNAKHPSCDKCNGCPMWQAKSIEEAQDWKRVTNEAKAEGKEDSPHQKVKYFISV